MDSAATRPAPGRRSRWGLPLVLERHQFEGVALRQQRAQQLVVQRMAGAEGAVARQQRLAQQVQVAHRVQDLVLDELVVVAQPSTFSTR
jgi:hypothetical protein